MIKKVSLLLFFICLVSQAIAQESTTPFKKGLWLSGLDGSISSTNNALASNNSNNNNFNTAYGFNISSSKIFKDRWTAGLVLAAQRASSDGIFNRQTESIFIGPSIRHFFSKAPQGSLYLEVAPGYVRFFEKSALTNTFTRTSESVDGNGFGLGMRFGYAHKVNDSVIFNFGMNFTNFWIWADRTQIPANTTTQEDLILGSLSFNFGFSVLLKKFFF